MKTIFKREGNQITIDGQKIHISGDMSALYALGGGIRYLGEVCQGDTIDAVNGWVIRNGVNAFKIHNDVSQRFGYYRKFFVHPGSVKERLLRTFEVVEKHYQKVTLKRWNAIVGQMKPRQVAHHYQGKGYYLTYEKSNNGLAMGSRKIEINNISNDLGLPSEESLALGKKVHQIEKRLGQIHSLRRLLNNMVLEMLVKPQLPKKGRIDEIVAIKMGGETFFFQYKYQHAQYKHWQLIAQTRNYSVKNFDTNNVCE